MAQKFSPGSGDVRTRVSVRASVRRAVRCFEYEKARHRAGLSVDGAKSLWLTALCSAGVTKA